MRRRKSLRSKYVVERRLAAGGMAEVWLARNRATGADVALKICKEELLTDDAVARFRHEARLGAMLSHRGIVRVFDLIEEQDERNGAPALVMELLRGETLERTLKSRGALPQGEAVAIAVAVLSALAHAHACGVIHRDVTPANVFLAVDPDGHVIPKLLDFGIAKAPAAMDHQTLDGRVLGTPGYMAPERIRGQEPVDERSDLFSVSVMIYEMLTGIGPFASSSPAGSLAAVLEDVVDTDPRIDPRVWLVLRLGLAKRPYERYPTAGAMAAALCDAVGETDAELPRWLRRVPPATDVLDATAEAKAGTQSVGGHSYGFRSARALGPKTLGWMAGVLTAGVVVGAVELWGQLPHDPNDAKDANGANAATATGQGVPSPSGSATTSMFEPAQTSGGFDASGAHAPNLNAHVDGPAAPTAAPSSSGEPPSRRRLHPPRPKPIATTPGF